MNLRAFFFDALLTSAIIMLTYLTVAILITHLAGVSFLSIWLFQASALLETEKV